MKLNLASSTVDFSGFYLSFYPSNNSLAVLVGITWSDGCFENQRLSINHQNIPALQLKDGEFIAKNYSENEHLYHELLRLGMIEVVPERPLFKTGYVELPICRLTPKGKSMVVNTSCN